MKPKDTPKKLTKEEKLAKALRDNLKKRKQQQRQRKETTKEVT